MHKPLAKNLMKVTLEKLYTCLLKVISSQLYLVLKSGGPKSIYFEIWGGGGGGGGRSLAMGSEEPPPPPPEKEKSMKNLPPPPPPPQKKKSPPKGPLD